MFFVHAMPFGLSLAGMSVERWQLVFYLFAALTFLTLPLVVNPFVELIHTSPGNIIFHGLMLWFATQMVKSTVSVVAQSP